MEERIENLDKKFRNLTLKNTFEFGLILLFGVFGLYWLSLNAIFGILVYCLVEYGLFKKFKKTLTEIENICEEKRSLISNIEYNTKIENIKTRFNSLSKEKQKELLKYIKSEENLKQLFMEVEKLDSEDKELLQEYFTSHIVSDKSDVQINKHMILPKKTYDLDLGTGKGRSRKRTIETERQSVTAADYNEDGQLQY